ncbi:uncharacterized protein TNCV_4028041 [Trichonephila clavipes]|nr:uncharacterized protein TNCV_4028041 [Trichonephila clavipes]
MNGSHLIGSEDVAKRRGYRSGFGGSRSWKNFDSRISIMLGNMHHLKNEDSHVWILIGTGNRVRYIDITKDYEHLGYSLSRCLPGFHAITGCDYNPAFFKKGKQKPFNTLKKNEEYQEAFMKFGNPDLFRDLELEKNVF